MRRVSRRTRTRRKALTLVSLCQHVRAPFHSYDDFYDPFRLLLVALGPDSTASRPTADSLHASFNDAETSKYDHRIRVMRREISADILLCSPTAASSSSCAS